MTLVPLGSLIVVLTVLELLRAAEPDRTPPRAVIFLAAALGVISAVSLSLRVKELAGW